MTLNGLRSLKRLTGPLHRARPLAFVLALVWPALLPATGGPHFERIGSESGPPSDVITEIWQDSTGFLWIGTRDGLLQYDGHTFRNFEHDASDPTSISDHSVRTIYEDSRGNLWIGTNTGGLNRLDRGSWTFEHFRHDSADPRSISHDSVYVILEDPDGSLWVGTQVGLNRFDPTTGTFERIRAGVGDPDSLSDDYVMTLVWDDEGRLIVGTLGGGVNVRDAGTGKFRAFRHDADDPTTLSSDGVSSLVPDGSGGLWVGTLNGLDQLDPETGEVRRYTSDPDDPASLSHHLVTSLAAGLPGRLWVGTHGGGLNELDMESGAFRSWRHQRERRNSLGDDTILKLRVDNTGALWIGTWGGGLNRLTMTSLMLSSLASTPESETLDEDITSLYHDYAGGIWVGTRGGTVLRMDPASGESRTRVAGAPEGPGRIIFGIDEDHEGNVWIGTNGELLRIDPDSEEITAFEHDPRQSDSIGAGYVRAVLTDGEDRLWVGTGEGGLQRVGADGRVLERFRHDPADERSLSDDYITALLEDGHGTLWVGTRSGGMNAFDPQTGRAVKYLPDNNREGAISHHYITSLFEDSSGAVWVGTSGGGVNRIDRLDDGEVRFTWFTELDGLIDNDVMAILEDVDGSLWFSTKRGLSRLSPDRELFAAVYVSDGLPTGEFESGAAARSRDTLYFGTVKGLVAIPLGTRFPEPATSPVVVTSILTRAGEVRGDSPVWALDSLEIPWGEWLSLKLAVLDYSPEQRHRYAYTIGRDWVDLASHGQITFSGLGPGLHEFRAQGRNSQGVWNEVSPLSIRVIPPFWMTSWFRVAVVLSIVALAVVGHRMRVNAVEERNRELVALHEQREKAQRELARAYQRLRRLTRRLEAAKEDERRRIARELHDEMGPTLTAVIINLQLLLESPDKGDVADRFADTIDLVDRLVDRVRDLSLDLRPPLLDELGLLPALKGYLESHANRTGIEIKVIDDGPTEALPAEIEIAAFRVVQEAVTNVIRHAGARRAIVSVTRENGTLLLRVKDDGRGFDVRATLDGASGKTLGLLGMQERVGILGGEVEIDSAPGRGTEVRARVPLEVAA